MSHIDDHDFVQGKTERTATTIPAAAVLCASYDGDGTRADWIVDWLLSRQVGNDGSCNNPAIITSWTDTPCDTIVYITASRWTPFAPSSAICSDGKWELPHRICAYAKSRLSYRPTTCSRRDFHCPASTATTSGDCPLHHTARRPTNASTNENESAGSHYEDMDIRRSCWEWRRRRIKEQEKIQDWREGPWRWHCPGRRN